MSTTYAQLKEAVKMLSGVTDSKTINLIPTFIRTAETKLDGDLRSQAMTATKTYPADGLTVPVELMSVDAVIIDGMDATLASRADVLQARRLDVRNPTIYAVVGNEYWLVAPAAVVVVGYQKPPRLSDATQTNAYTTDAENALLFQSLAYLNVYRKNPKDANANQSLANTEINNVNAQHEAQQKGAGLSYERPAKAYF